MTSTLTWQQVAESDVYKNASNAERLAMRDSFFNRHIKPNYPESNWAEQRAKLIHESGLVDKSTILEGPAIEKEDSGGEGPPKVRGEYLARRSGKGVVDAGRFVASGVQAMTGLPGALEMARKMFGLESGKGVVDSAFDWVSRKLGVDQESVGPSASKLEEVLGDFAELTTGSLATGGGAGLGRNAVQKILGQAIPISTAVAGGQVAQEMDLPKEAGWGAGGVAAVPVQALAARLGKAAGLLTKSGREEALATLEKGKSEIDELAAGVLKRSIGKELDTIPDTGKRIDEALDLQNKMKGLQFRLSQVTGAKGITASEQAVAKTDIEFLEKAAQQEAANREAIANYLRGGINAPGKKPLAYIDELEKSRRGSIEAARPARNIEQVGEDIVARRGALLKNEMSEVGKIYNRVREVGKQDYANGNGFDLLRVQAKAKELMGDGILQFEPKNAPPIMGRILTQDVADDALRNSSVDDVLALQEAVNQALARAKTSTDVTKWQQINRLKELKSELRSAVDVSPAQATASALKDANRQFVDRIVRPFRTGVSGKLERFNLVGDPIVRPDKVIAQYVPANSSRETRQFINTFGRDPEAMSLIDEGMKAKFFNEVFKEGEFDLARYNEFMKRHGQSIKLLDSAGPIKLKLGERFKKDAASVQLLSDEQAARLLDGRSYAKDHFVDILKQGDPEAVAAQALSDPKTMIRLTRNLGKDGAQALSHYAMRELAAKMSDGLNAEQMGKLLDNKAQRAAMQIMFRSAYGKEGAEHMKRLDQVRRALEINETAALSGVKPDQMAFKSDWFQRKFGVSMRSIFAFNRSIQQGRGSLQDAVIAIGGQVGAHRLKQMVGALEQQALSDPETSKAFLASLKNSGDDALKARSVAKLLAKAGFVFMGGKFIVPNVQAVMPTALGSSGSVEEEPSREISPDIRAAERLTQ